MESRVEKTRNDWLSILERHRSDFVGPGGSNMWSPKLDGASRDELTAIQNEKLSFLAPFLYENSKFYKARFERLRLIPDDIKTLEDLKKWPVVTKDEMTLDAEENPPFGTYSTMSDELWKTRGWMMFSTSGTTGRPRVFRYSQIDRQYWEWTNCRAMSAMDFDSKDTVFMMTGYGPHVWAWGVQYALARMQIPLIPGGGTDGIMRARFIDQYKPTILLCTPSYSLYLGRLMQEQGMDPASTSVTRLFLAGEPANSISSTRERIQNLWNAKIVEFYGCTEAAPQAGGFSCRFSQTGKEPFAHLLEDAQIWETVDPETLQPTMKGGRGLTVCTNIISESSPQLRFLVGDYTTLQDGLCDCGRSHVRAMGCFAGRADDLINLRGIKLFPTQIERVIRGISGLGDEFKIVLNTRAKDGMDIMTILVEDIGYRNSEGVQDSVVSAIRAECEIRVDVEVLAPGTLPKTEFKSNRVSDERVRK